MKANPSNDEIRRPRRLSWREYGRRMFARAMDDNLAILARAVGREAADHGRLSVLDLGCWDGATTARYVPANAARFGVEQDPIAAATAVATGFRVVRVDLNRPLPFAAGSFDVVTSNQVFEHLHDTDTFVAEAHRILRPGGLALISTENLASWHNIASLLFGWQAFSLTNVSRQGAGLGNPLANLRGDDALDSGWQHQRIFSYRGLAELLERHGFEDVRVRGAGYYPLPSRVATIDPRHAALIVVEGRKPRSR